MKQPWNTAVLGFLYALLCVANCHPTYKVTKPPDVTTASPECICDGQVEFNTNDVEERQTQGESYGHLIDARFGQPTQECRCDDNNKADVITERTTQNPNSGQQYGGNNGQQGGWPTNYGYQGTQYTNGQPPPYGQFPNNGPPTQYGPPHHHGAPPHYGPPPPHYGHPPPHYGYPPPNYGPAPPPPVPTQPSCGQIFCFNLGVGSFGLKLHIR